MIQSKNKHQLPSNIEQAYALIGYGTLLAWEDTGEGRQLLELPPTFNGATVRQSYEI
jgi:hypothetical protein